MGEQSKEEAILRVQWLDLIYSQLSMLLKILTNAPWAEMDLMKETPGPHADGFIVSTFVQVTNSMGNVSLQQKKILPRSKQAPLLLKY